jgi:hypothetical protein
MCCSCDASPATTGVAVDVEALTREFDAYSRHGETTRMFPTPTPEQIARAQRARSTGSADAR